ncbi:hypothetical protein MHTCC0001_30640 [Flavobacteriaceae bacterium MHTCC 0001]
MSLKKLEYLKAIIEKELSNFDYDREIEKFREQEKRIIETPADEYSFTGNIEHGITNLVNAASGSSHPVGYLTGQKKTYESILELLKKGETELEKMLLVKPNKNKNNRDSIIDEIFSKAKNEPSNRKHFYDCKLTDEEWGSENCVCPGAYVYKKYLSIGLSKEEAKLISTYTEIGDIMGEDYERAKALYEKYKFLKIN